MVYTSIVPIPGPEYAGHMCLGLWSPGRDRHLSCEDQRLGASVLPGNTKLKVGTILYSATWQV